MNAALLTGPLAQAIGWALLHLVWQATIVAGILAGVLALLSSSNANARYAASCAALAVVFTMFIATAVRSWDPHVAPVTAASVAAPETITISISQIPAFVAKSAALGVRDRLITSLASARATFPIVVGLWLAGVALLSARLFVSWTRARRWVRHGASAADVRWQRLAAKLSEVLGLRRAVTILESAAVEVPFVIGSLRPVIVLPASTLTGLTPEQIEMVLAHEFAHIRRHDFLVNLLQAVVETLMFYHPAVWWMSHRVRVERENCCDDLAVAVCGNPVQYARALARLEELRAAGPAIAVAANGTSLLERIRRIGGFRTERTAAGPGWTAAAAMTSLLVIAIAVPSLPALAERHPKAKPAKLQAPHGTIDVVSTPVEASASVRVAVDAEAPVIVDLDSDVETPEAPEALAPPDTEDGIEAPDTPEPAGTPVAPEAPAVPRVAGVATPVAMYALAPAAPVPPGTPAPVVAPAPAAAPAPTPAPAPRIRERIRVAPVARGMKVRSRDLAMLPDGRPTIESLIAMKASGVSAAYVEEMREFFPRLTLDDAVGMAAVGVTREYVRGMRDAGIRMDDAEQAMSMRAVGVTPAYVQEMQRAGLRGNVVDQIISMRAVGISSGWLQSIRDAGVTVNEINDAVSMRALGVNAAFVRRLTQAGYTNITPDELVQLAATGVDDDFIREMQKYRRK